MKMAIGNESKRAGLIFVVVLLVVVILILLIHVGNRGLHPRAAVVGAVGAGRHSTINTLTLGRQTKREQMESAAQKQGHDHSAMSLGMVIRLTCQQGPAHH